MEHSKSFISIEEKTKIRNRLNKIEGQINGIKGMIDQDRTCEDILIQISSVTQAIKGVSSMILDDYILKEFDGLSEEKIKDVSALLKKYM